MPDEEKLPPNTTPQATALDIASLLVAITSIIYLSGIGYSLGVFNGLQITHSIIDTTDLYGILTTGFIALSSGYGASPYLAISISLVITVIFLATFTIKYLPLIVKYIISFSLTAIIVFFSGYSVGSHVGEQQLRAVSMNFASSVQIDSPDPEVSKTVSIDYINSQGLPDSLVGVYLRSANHFYYYFTQGEIVGIKSDRIIKVALSVTPPSQKKEAGPSKKLSTSDLKDYPPSKSSDGIKEG